MDIPGSLEPVITQFHTYPTTPNQTSSLLSQTINAPPHLVWSILRQFDKPQTYKHFIKSCHLNSPSFSVGSTREVNVISGLPADTSTERLDILDDDRYVTGFTIIGGEHRLRNYKSVTSVHEVACNDKDKNKNMNTKTVSVVFESYVVDVPEGNSEEDTKLFADTVVKLNLQKLAQVAEALVDAS